MNMNIVMRGYATRDSQKDGETDDGKQDYFYSRRMHLLGSFEINGEKKYIDEHTTEFRLPYIVKEENINRRLTTDPVYVSLCKIISFIPKRNQAGEPCREKGFDLFEAELEIV